MAVTIERLTPRGAGGIAVVALRGPGRHAAAGAWLRTRDGRPAAATGPGPRRLWLWLDGEPQDEVLVVDRPELGQLELHLHGAETVLAALAAQAGGFVDAGPGPCATAPAERLLREALSEAQLALALEQRSLDFEAFLQDLDARGPAPAARRDRALALRRSRAALALAQPCRLVLCGAQNAGKSTLMNRLLFSERVLTGPHPGLTRDPVREITALAGYPYLLIDTAGEGEAATTVDRAAIARGRAERAGAWRLLVVDGSRGVGELERSLLAPRTLVIRTKTDLPEAAWPAGFPCELATSVLDPEPGLRAALGAALQRRRGLPAAGPAGGPAALDHDQMRRLRG